jgi:hypothetical protein
MDELKLYFCAKSMIGKNNFEKVGGLKVMLPKNKLQFLFKGLCNISFSFKF